MKPVTDMMKVNCDEARAELPLYVGGDLERETEARVELHLDGCDACGLALDEALAAREVLREHYRSPEVELHRPELWSGIRAGLLEQGLIRSLPQVGSEVAYGGTEVGEPVSGGSASESRPQVLRRGRLLRMASVAAAASMLFFLGTLNGRHGRVPASDGSLPEVAPANSGGVGARGGDGLVLDQPTTRGDLQPVRASFEPLGDDRNSMKFQAEPWGGYALPASNTPQNGASPASYPGAPAARDGQYR